MATDHSTSTGQRRLAAIFCADVEGYTRLMNADEAATLRLLSACRDITDRLIAQHGGRIANTAGDSILAEFPSAVDALQCALGLQDRVAAMNEEVPEERRIRFRVGIHVGEVVVRSGDLFGDAVNIAARMQGLAAPGAVCLSDTAHQFTHRAVPSTFEDLGPQLVKNVDSPIGAYLVRPPSHSHSSAIPSIHRRIEAHLARRFYDVCHHELFEITRPERLTVVEYSALASLEDAPGIDQQRLAARVGIDLRTTANVLKRLRARAFVEATPSTGGRQPRAFRLTQSGLDMRRRLRPAVVAALDRIVAPLSEEERETLKDLLVRIIQAHEAQNQSALSRQA